jgi:hypothetical protein
LNKYGGSQISNDVERRRFLPVILINGALSEGIFVFVRIGETSGSNNGSLLIKKEVRMRVRDHIPGEGGQS